MVFGLLAMVVALLISRLGGRNGLLMLALAGVITGALFDALIGAGVLIVWLYRWRLNIISLSETDARSLGVNLARIRRILIVAATLITAAAVSAAGIIAWIATGCEAEAGFTSAPAS